MDKVSAQLIELTHLCDDHNRANVKDVIRSENLVVGVRIWITFEAANGQNYVHENLTPWRALHQKKRISVMNPLAWAFGSLVQKRDEFKP